MKVRELINQLAQHDPERELVTYCTKNQEWRRMENGVDSPELGDVRVDGELIKDAVMI